MRSFRLAVFALLALLGTAGVAAAQDAVGQPTPWQLGFQTAATPVAEQMHQFHHLLLVIISVISLFVLGLLIYVGYRFRASRNPTPSKTTHNTLVEVVWTVVPVLILLVIAIPSFRLLYYGDRAQDPEMTLIAKGYQWYWGYEYPDQQIAEFQSFLVPEENLAEGQVRLLSTDAPVVLPVDTDIQILVTAGDVLHSWAMPSMGVKTDAITGRTNETWVRIEEEGIYYGQCSEVCGTGHAFMPIEVHAVSREEFDAWVVEQTAGLDLEEPPVLLTMTWEEAMAKRQLALNVQQ
ncbi:cytochrome c oxidase subunit II [Inquilinus sp. CAU 1745]|uniref:cytochrome c oxidase subunit II n=1 Tax=Inquilinus sp. CAU 1745 TaxID=3140369 RepID=UPI00325A9520